MVFLVGSVTWGVYDWISFEFFSMATIKENKNVNIQCVRQLSYKIHKQTTDILVLLHFKVDGTFK